MAKLYWDYDGDEGDPVEVEIVDLPAEAVRAMRRAATEKWGMEDRSPINMSELYLGLED